MIDVVATKTPLLKWPGGKRNLVQHILPLIPRSFQTYYEPFLGGGALFFALSPAQAALSDNNLELINCYTQIRDNVASVVERLSKMKNSPEDYYVIRDSSPADEAERAARFIYLSTLSFNGIYRVNRAGKFNVPYGHKKHLAPCDESKLRATSLALASAHLGCCDFEDAVADAGSGDLVYLDPPYTVAHSNNGFVKYNAKIFAWEDQTRLAEVAVALDRRGCRVVISNADHPSVKELYRGFQHITITRPSRIAASSAHRRRITECVFFNGV